MPMHTEYGRLTIVYNGEISNYPELRDKLRSLGYSFRSECDTEVGIKVSLQQTTGLTQAIKSVEFKNVW